MSYVCNGKYDHLRWLYPETYKTLIKQDEARIAEEERVTRRINEGKDPKAPSTDQGSRRSTKEVVELDPAEAAKRKYQEEEKHLLHLNMSQKRNPHGAPYT
jgi:hypothetical protein